METQKPLRILSLDGGGVRGISSLYILKEVMAQVRRQQRSANEPEQTPLRPCDVFDLICGTSTGGLIALMLGRLEMSVDEAIVKYLELSKTIFGAMSNENPITTFDHRAMDNVLKKFITESPLNLPADAPLADENTCKTFIIAIRTRALGAAVRMRTYNTGTSDAFSARIWEAARATSAAPMLFKPITINGVTYGDGEIGWNNPTAEAIAETHKIWPNRPIGCLLSIGTGLEKAIQLSNDDEDSSKLWEGLLHSFAPKESFGLGIAKCCVASLRSCEKIHRDVSSQFPDRIIPHRNFFRFNVPQGMSEVGVEEWKKIDDIVALTESYMEHGDIEEWKITVANLLLNPQVADFSNKPIKSKYFMVPYDENPWFIGREKLLKKLSDMLSDEKPHQWNHRVALYGMGGIGKTQTALAYTYLKRSTYESIFWISAVDQGSLLSGFQQIAAVTHCLAEGSKPAKVAKRVLEWLEQQSNWLFIIDNLDDVSVIDDFLPPLASKGHILITTRNPNTHGIPAQGLEVDLLDINASVELFRIHLGTPSPLNAENDVSEIRNIVKELGYLPLAIEQSAAFIRETKMDIDEYLPLYQKNRSTRQELFEWVPEGNRRYPYSIATTWKMSITNINDNSESPQAASLLTLFAFLNPDLILLEFLKVGANALENGLSNLLKDTMQMNKTIRVLERFSLIKRIQGDRGIWIHRLIQDVIQHDLKEEDRVAWWDRIVEVCLIAFPEEITETTRSLCRRYEEQVLVPLSKSPQMKSPALAQLCCRVGNFLYDDGKYLSAEILYDMACKIYDEIRGGRHHDTLRAIEGLASTYWRQGRWDEAITLDEEVLKTRKVALGDRHPDTLNAMANLAATYGKQGRWDEAVTLEEEVLKTRKVVLGDRHPDTLSAMANLAGTYRKQGRWDEAAVLREEVLKTSKVVLGDRHPDTLSAMSNLAATYCKQGRWDEAVTLEVDVLKTSNVILGDRHPDTLSAMANLAATYRKQGRWHEAAALEEEVLKTRKVVLGDRHPDTLSAMASLAATYREQGRWNEAVTLEGEVLKTGKMVLGDRHPDTLSAMASLAATYREQGRWNEAVTLVEEVLKARKMLLGDGHPDTLGAMANLASTYRQQGRWNEAVTLAEEVLKARKMVLGDGHPDTLSAMVNLAATYWEQGRWDEAVTLEEEALKTRKVVLGDRHPDTLRVMANLAATYREQGRRDEAVTLEEEVLNTTKVVLGDRHPDTLNAMANLATTYGRQGRWDEAVMLEEEVLKISKLVFGDRHPDTLNTMASLAWTYWNQQRRDEAIALQKKTVGDSQSILGETHPDTLIRLNHLVLMSENE